jgi:hypothetical protein
MIPQWYPNFTRPSPAVYKYTMSKRDPTLPTIGTGRSEKVASLRDARFAGFQEQLRRMYGEILDEAIPERLRDLINRLPGEIPIPPADDPAEKR